MIYLGEMISTIFFSDGHFIDMLMNAIALAAVVEAYRLLCDFISEKYKVRYRSSMWSTSIVINGLELGYPSRTGIITRQSFQFQVRCTSRIFLWHDFFLTIRHVFHPVQQWISTKSLVEGIMVKNRPNIYIRAERIKLFFEK